MTFAIRRALGALAISLSMSTIAPAALAQATIKIGEIHSY